MCLYSPGGADGANDPSFDDNNEVEGELYKINMSLDRLERDVQENLKQKTARSASLQHVCLYTCTDSIETVFFFCIMTSECH